MSQNMLCFMTFTGPGGARCSCPMPRGALLRGSWSAVFGARVMVAIRGRGEALSCPGNLCAFCPHRSFPPSSLSWLSSRPHTPCRSLASSGVGTSLRWHSELATCYFPVDTASDTSNNFPEFKEGLASPRPPHLMTATGKWVDSRLSF